VDQFSEAVMFREPVRITQPSSQFFDAQPSFRCYRYKSQKREILKKEKLMVVIYAVEAYFTFFFLPVYA